MDLLVDHDHPLPLKDQLAAILREQILSGKLQPGERLPSTRKIASAHGVSLGTASNAIAELVDEGIVKTREKCGAYIAERSITKRKPKLKTIGLLIDAIDGKADPYFAMQMQAVSTCALEQGIAVLMLSDANNDRCEERLLTAMRTGSIDGVIYPVSMFPDDRITGAVLSHRLPLVLIDSQIADQRVDSVMLDNVNATRSAVRNLFELGHRHIAFMAVAPETISVAERYQGYCEALSEAGVTADPSLNMRTEYGVEAGQEGMQTLLKAGATAVFCIDDFLARGAIEATEQAGLRVPEDISVIGFGNFFPLDRQLTTHRIDFEQMAQGAIDCLEKRLQSPQRVATTVRVDAAVIEKQSTAERRCDSKG